MAAAGQRRRPALADLSEMAADWRNRLIGSRRFQRWAAAFPLTRRLARRDGERLFDLMAGFVYSQTLLACVELGLLRQLRGGPRHSGELAAPLGLDEDRAATLCQSAASVGLLEKRRDGRFQLGRLGAAVPGVPGLEAMIRHNGMFYRDLADPGGLLRGVTDPELARFWPYVLGADAEVGGAAAEAYSELMATSQALVAEEVLRSVRLDGVSHLMDVGGGTGTFLGAVAEAYPDMRLTLFDLPAVTGAAERALAAGGLDRRIGRVAGNFRTDPLPDGADAVSLVRVLYDHGDETVAGLLQRVTAALPPDGRLIVAEPMSGGARPSRFGDGYFAFYTMAMRTGHVRSPARIAELMAEAGFERVAFPRTFRPFVTGIVTARKPCRARRRPFLLTSKSVSLD
jgi:demethylspheroidene O-methyltransferase